MTTRLPGRVHSSRLNGSRMSRAALYKAGGVNVLACGNGSRHQEPGYRRCIAIGSVQMIVETRSTVTPAPKEPHTRSNTACSSGGKVTQVHLRRKVRLYRLQWRKDETAFRLAAAKVAQNVDFRFGRTVVDWAGSGVGRLPKFTERYRQQLARNAQVCPMNAPFRVGIRRRSWGRWSSWKSYVHPHVMCIVKVARSRPGWAGRNECVTDYMVYVL